MDTRPPLPDWHRSPAPRFCPDRQTVQRWLDAYVAAWIAYDEAMIADLWSCDAVWYRPFGVRATGREEITAAWMSERHLFTPGGYNGAYVPIAIDDGIVVTHGRTRFLDVETGAMRGEFDNVWVLRFTPDGRCVEFHEWYAGRPEHDPSRG